MNNKHEPVSKVILIGRGAVGTVMGSILQQELGNSFAFVVDPERKERYMKKPLQVNGEYPDFHYISSPSDAIKEGMEPFGQADLVLIATKYGALEEAMNLAAPFLKEDTILMPAINGLKSEEDLRRRFPDQITLRTIAQKMDANYHDNQVEYTQKGELVFGADDSQESEADQNGENLTRQQAAALAVLELFNKAELPCVHSDDIVYDQWNKLMLNCGINQVCAACNATYGDVIARPELYELFTGAMQEVAQTAQAYGLRVGEEQIQAWVAAVKALAPDSMPSMQQDVLAKRPTEEELFSAYVIPLAQAKGVETPVLQLLKDKVDAIDAALNQ